MNQIFIQYNDDIFYIDTSQYGGMKLPDIALEFFDVDVDDVNTRGYFLKYILKDGEIIGIQEEDLDSIAEYFPFLIKDSTLVWHVNWRDVTLNDLVCSRGERIIPNFEGLKFGYFDLLCASELFSFADLIQLLNDFKVYLEPIEYAKDLIKLTIIPLIELLRRNYRKWRDNGARGLEDVLLLIFSREIWTPEELCHLLHCDESDAKYILENLGYKNNGMLYFIDKTQLARSFYQIINNEGYSRKRDVLLALLGHSQRYYDGDTETLKQLTDYILSVEQTSERETPPSLR